MREKLSLKIKQWKMIEYKGKEKWMSETEGLRRERIERKMEEQDR